MDVFYHGRQLCELFKSENNGFDINFNINSGEVAIFVLHYGKWDSQKGKSILNKLWENFKLPVIGWENNCKVLNYKDINDDVLISEYIFTMRHFNYWKTMVDEFQEYNSKYVTEAEEGAREI